jgi:hypothetical protein
LREFNSLEHFLQIPQMGLENPGKSLNWTKKDWKVVLENQ